MKPIVVYKWLDVIFQVVYFPLFIIVLKYDLLKPIFIKFRINDEELGIVMFGYMLFGGIQLVSNIIHHFLQDYIVLHSRRKLYNLLSIVVFIASIFLLFVINLKYENDNNFFSVVANLLIFPIVLTSPFWAIYYFILSVKELNWLRYENKLNTIL
jgi:hypothetical protein